jgi:transposase InsO family protein
MKKVITVQDTHQVWSSDFTHLYFKGMQFYVATVLDEYSKQIVGYSIALHHSKELILQAIQNAV